MSVEQRMKGQGNQGNNGSTTNVQYPPFSVKVGQWSNHAGSNSSSTNTNNKDKFGNHRSDGNNDYNAWGGSQQVNNQYHSSRNKQGHGYDEYNNYNKGGYHVNDGGIKGIERGMQGLGLDQHNSGGRFNASSHDRNAPPNSQSNSHSSGGNRQEQQQKDAARKMTWASIASQPAKPTVSTTSNLGIKKKPGMPPPPMVPGRHNMDIGTWDSPAKNGPPMVPPPIIQNIPSQPPKPDFPGLSEFNPPAETQTTGSRSVEPRNERNAVNERGYHNNSSYQSSGPQREGRQSSHPSNNVNQNYNSRNDGFNMPPPIQQQQQQQHPAPASNEPPVTLDTLLDMSKYNPAHFEIENVHLARFFVIKSYSEDDIHRSIKYNIWCSTEHGNKRLDQAFHEREKEGGAVYLFYSVNSSGHFCGMAQMISPVDYSSNSSVWAQDKWKGSFKVRWIYVKDVPNQQLRQIRLENNEGKPVTNSRDATEVPNTKGQQVWRIIHSYKHSTSLFDDFVHYEQRQREEDSRRIEPGPMHQQRMGSPQFEKHRGYGESNNNPRDMGPPSHQYERGYHSNDSKYGSGGFNGRNNYAGNSGFERNYHGNGGSYENKHGPNSGNYNRNYGYNRRDDQQGSGGLGMDRQDGGYSSGNYSRGGGYRNNRGGFNNDYYNRRQEPRDRGELRGESRGDSRGESRGDSRGDRGYRPQYNSVDPEKE